jgi:hypothetical protein
VRHTVIQWGIYFDGISKSKEKVVSVRKVLWGLLSVAISFMVTACGGSGAAEQDITFNSGVCNILLSGDGYLMDGCNGNFQIQHGEESSPLFIDPFFGLKEGEEISFQYFSGTMLYYLKTLENANFELHRIDISSYEDFLIYESSSSASREYNYLGIMDSGFLSQDSWFEMKEEEVSSFCVLGNNAYLVRADGIYRLDLLTGYEKRVIDNVNDGTAVSYKKGKFYYMDNLYHLNTYDILGGETEKLTSWPVSKQYIQGDFNFVQRMNGALYRYSLETGEMVQIKKKTGTLMYADDSYIYCTSGDEKKLLVYRITDGEMMKKISLQGALAGVATLPGENKVYIVEVKGDRETRRNVYIQSRG